MIGSPSPVDAERAPAQTVNGSGTRRALGATASETAAPVFDFVCRADVKGRKGQRCRVIRRRFHLSTVEFADGTRLVLKTMAVVLASSKSVRKGGRGESPELKAEAVTGQAHCPASDPAPLADGSSVQFNPGPSVARQGRK